MLPLPCYLGENSGFRCPPFRPGTSDGSVHLRTAGSGVTIENQFLADLAKALGGKLGVPLRPRNRKFG
jgi:hypothetical protein